MNSPRGSATVRPRGGAASGPAAAPALPGRRILVIKLGALGDMVLAMGPFAAIRAAHPEARVTLLTHPAFAALMQASPWFDEIWTDPRPPAWQVWRHLALRARLRAARFDRVYDLQTHRRTALYFRLLGPGPKPEWSGVARGCSHPHTNPDRNRLHTIERQAEQLAIAGIATVPPTDVSWLTDDIGRFALPARYALLSPGASAGHPEKRWPADRYAALAADLAARGIAPVVLGTGTEADAAAAIQATCPAAVSLIDRTTLAEIAALARGAVAAVGNDTGPMHLIAATGCPTVSLFGPASDPALCAPRGAAVTVIRRPDLSALSPAEVGAAALAAAGA